MLSLSGLGQKCGLFVVSALLASLRAVSLQLLSTMACEFFMLFVGLVLFGYSPWCRPEAIRAAAP